MFGTVKVKNKKTGQWVAVDAVKGQLYDSGWVTFKEWGEDENPGYRPMQYRKIGNVVYIRGAFSFYNDFLTLRHILGTLPEECRPSQKVTIVTDCLGDEDIVTEIPCLVKCAITTSGLVEGFIVPTVLGANTPTLSDYFQASIDCSYVVD